MLQPTIKQALGVLGLQCSICDIAVGIISNKSNIIFMVPFLIYSNNPPLEPCSNSSGSYIRRHVAKPGSGGLLWRKCHAPAAPKKVQVEAGCLRHMRAEEYVAWGGLGFGV